MTYNKIEFIISHIATSQVKLLGGGGVSMYHVYSYSYFTYTYELCLIYSVC